MVKIKWHKIYECIAHITKLNTPLDLCKIRLLLHFTFSYMQLHLQALNAALLR